MLKEILRGCYRTLPLKRPVFEWLRARTTLSPALWDHLYFEGEFDSDLADKKVRMQNYNGSLETAIFWAGFYGGYEPMSQRVWIELSKQAATIVDVGANTGLYTLIAKTVNPNAAVWSFEPIERIYQRLVHNVELNGMGVNHRQCAVSNADGESVIYDLPFDHHWHASLLKEEVAHLGNLIEYRIRTCRLDTIIDTEIKTKVDLIKIDAEGSEPLVLEGLGKYLQTSTPTLLLEVKSADKAEAISTLIRDLDYVYFNIDEKCGLRRLSQLQGSSNRNVLLCRPDAVERLLGTTGLLFDQSN